MDTGMVTSDELRHDALEARAKLRAKLDEVEHYLKAGWTKLRTKLDHWLEPDRPA